MNQIQADVAALAQFEDEGRVTRCCDAELGRAHPLGLGDVVLDALPELIFGEHSTNIIGERLACNRIFIGYRILDQIGVPSYHLPMGDEIESRLPPHKQVILDRMEEAGHDMQSLSLLIGRKESYVQQYVRYGKPKKLDGDDRRLIAEALGVSEMDLMPPPSGASNPARQMGKRALPRSIAPVHSPLSAPVQVDDAQAIWSPDGRSVLFPFYLDGEVALLTALPADRARRLAKQILKDDPASE